MRPVESKLCLQSLRENTKFECPIIFLSNGGDQDYVWQFYKNGLIDKLILRKTNSGCGLGTRELMNDFDSEWVFYIQEDQYLGRELIQEEIGSYIKKINNNECCCVDLAGDQGRGRFSERAFFLNKNFYNSIPNDIGGPGPFADHKWTEQCVQEYIENNNLKIYHAPIAFGDNGKISFREFPCGGQTLHFTDTKQLWILRPLKREYHDFPFYQDLMSDEWKLILGGKWKGGTIPQYFNNPEKSFKIWKRPSYLDDLIGI
jgi:hypothetical protein